MSRLFCLKSNRKLHSLLLLINLNLNYENLFSGAKVQLFFDIRKFLRDFSNILCKIAVAHC